MSSEEEDSEEAEWEELDASQREGKAASWCRRYVWCVCCLVAVLGDLLLSPPTTANTSSSSQAALEIVLTRDGQGKKRWVREPGVSAVDNTNLLYW